MLHHIISSSCKILPKSVGANSNVSKECGFHGTHGTHADEGPDKELFWLCSLEIGENLLVM